MQLSCDHTIEPSGARAVCVTVEQLHVDLAYRGSAAAATSPTSIIIISIIDDDSTNVMVVVGLES